MSVNVDISYKSLNKHEEELCGDKVELLKTADSDIIILADGMGSGVKANILATLTSKILGTMLINGASLEDCVETIILTLPVCKIRQVAYSTFSILQIYHSGEAYLVEFDNPGCIFIREGKLIQIPFEERVIHDKKIREYRCNVNIGDYFLLMSDGVVHAGVGKLLNFGWSWEHVAEYAVNATKTCTTADRLVTALSDACDELYMQSPGDDATVAVAKVTVKKVVALLTGPPVNPEDDQRMIEEFMEQEGKKVVCGGTTANIISRELQRGITTSLEYLDPNVPPIAHIAGIDLVTEGVLTLTKTLHLLQKYANNEVDEDFFIQLDQKNGAAMVAKIIIEECSDLYLYVGRAINVAHQNPELPFDLSIRMNLVHQIETVVKKMGKQITIKYY
ncbi:MAG: SpoIIE family protein phosphatase [bacterium]|nr:SpoIIE family protein phosphatase [bacterium]